MRNLPDPDFPRFVADPGTCSFTLVNSRPDPGDLDRPAPCLGTPAVTAPDPPGVLDELRFHAAREHLDRDPDPAPPQSLAEAWVHCRTTLERLAAGDEGVYVPDALVAVEGVAAAVRAVCAKAVRDFDLFTGAGYCDDQRPGYDPARVHDYGRGGCDARRYIAKAIDALDLGGPPA